jgi:hypothetical protein
MLKATTVSMAQVYRLAWELNTMEMIISSNYSMMLAMTMH